MNNKSIEVEAALRLALEVLEEIALAGMSGTGQESKEGMTEWHARQAWKFISIAARALGPIRDVLAQQSPQRSEDTKERSDWNEQVDEPVAVYGYCPECGAQGVARERRPDGNDRCANGHTYPSRAADHGIKE